MSQISFEKIYESGRPGEKTVVLWVSRHPPLPIQIQRFEERLGGIEIWQLSGRVPDAEFVAEKAKEVNARYIVPVLPLSMIARLVELAKREGFIVLWAEMEQVSQGTGTPPEIDRTREVIVEAHGTWKVMRFKQFHVIKAVKLELEPF